jgi:hypothetical protein
MKISLVISTLISIELTTSGKLLQITTQTKLVEQNFDAAEIVFEMK